MKRATGWFLGLLTVATFAGGGWFALRGILKRETATVAFLAGTGRDPTDRALLRGAQVALAEFAGRAGRFRIELGTKADSSAACIGNSEAILFEGDLQPLPLLVSAFETHPRELLQTFRITPSLEQQGQAAAAWSKRQKAVRASVIYDDQNPRSQAIGIAFNAAARASGMDVRCCAWNHPVDGSLGRVDDFLDTKPDFLFYAGEDAPYGRTYQLFLKLRELGFTGPLLSGEADPEVSLLATRPDLVDGTYLVSPFAPAPAELARTLGSTPGPHVTAGYFAMKAALEAIDRANSADPAELRRAAARLPYFDDQGRAALRKCALYVARKGTFEFVELLD